MSSENPPDTPGKRRNPWWLIALGCLGIAATLLLTLWMSTVEPYRRQTRIVEHLEKSCLYQPREVQPPSDSVFGDLLKKHFEDGYQNITGVFLSAKNGIPGHGAIPDSTLRQLRRLPFLENAEIYQSEPFTFEQLQILLSGRKTTTWKIHAALQLSDAQVRRLPGNLPLPALILDLAHCPDLTETGIAELLDKCPHLEVFGIVGDENQPAPWGRAAVEAICRHPELKNLGLKSVVVDPVDVPLFRVLTSLESLSLQNGPDLADALLDALPGSISLKYFIHMKSGLTGKGVERLKAHPSLTNLLLNDADLSDTDMEHLKGLPSLFQLALDDTQVGDAGLEHLKALPLLHDLSLKNTPLTDAGLEHIPGMNLRQLGIAGTRVTNAGWETLKDAQGLATLEMDAELLTDDGIEAMKSMNTGILHLHGSGDTALARLKELPRLPSLSFTNRDLSDEDFTHLAAIPELRLLNLSGPEITDATIDRLLRSGLKLNILQLLDTSVSRKCYENYRRTVSGEQIIPAMKDFASIYIHPMPEEGDTEP